ncbi:MAG: aminoglycoside phosphotransferase family protein [bacterium]
MPGALEEVIQRLLAQAAELWPGTPPQRITVTKQIQRPYSNTFRLALLPGEQAQTVHYPAAVYAKIIRPTAKNRDNTQKYVERLQKEFEVARLLRARLPTAREFGVVHPVAYYGDLLCLVTTEASGIVLADVIAAGSKRWHGKNAWPNIARHCRRAGALLAAIQVATPETQPLRAEELLEYVEIRLQRLVASPAVPFSEPEAAAVRKFLEKTLAHMPVEQWQQSGCHSDYAPFNLLADTARMTVFDFAMFKTGSVYNDLAYFCHRLEGYLHKPTFSPSAIHALQHAFLEGYSQAGPGENRGLDHDPMFCVFLIKHVVNNYSAIMRQRVAGPSAHLSLPTRLFNRRVFRRYNDWLLHICKFMDSRVRA